MFRGRTSEHQIGGAGFRSEHQVPVRSRPTHGRYLRDGVVRAGRGWTGAGVPAPRANTGPACLCTTRRARRRERLPARDGPGSA
jgi:hypothetical protein